MPRISPCNLNHPCPIFCPTLSNQCSNEVINPTTSGVYGFFNNTSVGTVGVGSTLPLTLVIDGGISGSDGSITLESGTYSVSYFVQGTVPSGETMSVALELDGTRVSGSQIGVTETTEQVATLSQTIALTATGTQTLTLVNTSGESTTYATASIFVSKV